MPFSGSALVWVQLSYEQSCPAKEARKGGVDLRIRCLPNRRTGYYDAVPSRLNLTHTQPYRFTHPSLDTVPYNGIAYAAAYRESEPAVWKAILQNAQDSEAVAIRLSPPADLLEPAVVPYSIASFQAAALPKDSVCSRVGLVGRGAGLSLLLLTQPSPRPPAAAPNQRDYAPLLQAGRSPRMFVCELKAGQSVLSSASAGAASKHYVRRVFSFAFESRVSAAACEPLVARFVWAYPCSFKINNSE